MSVPPASPRETSTKWVQNSLFLLGGLLLAVAAIVFTAVAWAQFGVGGRAALLAGFTGAALAVPPLTARRGLAATAETFAAIGLLLILLDGYAAWYVNLFAVTRLSPWSYAALVFAVTALVALAFPRLSGPRFVALLLAQPVLPLLLVPAGFGAIGHAFTYAGVLALDLTVLVATRGRVRIAGGSLAGVALLPVTVFALTALLPAAHPGQAALAGAALLPTTVLPLIALVLVGRRPAVRAVFAGGLVIEVAVAGVRIAALAAPAHAFLAGSLALLGVALLAATARSVWLDGIGARGVRIGAGIAVSPYAVAAVAAVAAAAVNAASTLRAAGPALHAHLATRVPAADPLLLAVIAAVAPAVAVTVPAAWRRLTVLSAGVLAILAVPAALALPWWTAPLLDVTAVAVLLFLASRTNDALFAALLLVAHGVAVAFGAPAVTAATLPALSVLGAASAALTRRVDLAGPGLFASLVLVPAVAWSSTAAVTSSPLWQSRITLAATSIPLLAGISRGHRLGRLRPFALIAAVVPIAVAPLWAAPAGDSTAIYAAVALLGLSLLAADQAAWFAAVPPFAAFVVATAVPLSRLLLVAPGWKRVPDVPLSVPIAFALLTTAVLLAVSRWTSGEKRRTRVVHSAPPRTGWGWLGNALRPAFDLGTGASRRSETGREAGGESLGQRRQPGLSAPSAMPGPAPLAALTGVPLAVLTGTPSLALTIALALAAARVPWPYLPGAELLLGLIGLLAVALRDLTVATTTTATAATTPAATTPTTCGTPRAGLRTAYEIVVFMLLAWAGLAGALAGRPAATAAFGAVLVAGVVAGAAGRTLEARLTGWLAAIVAAAGVLHDVDRGNDAFPLLGLAALTVALSWLLHRRGRTVESRAVEAAAHAGAFLSLLLALGGARTAPAIVWFVWGAALGVRALRRAGRDAYLVAAAVAELAGWCRLLLVHRVGLVEAYSIPAAAVALLAGIVVRRKKGEPSSWVAYGPALAAALLPSLAAIAGSDGQYLRRLLLGLASLAVLLAGARGRLQAPVVLGGGVLAVVALHELAQVWDLIPRWIPLAAAGLLLVVVAATLERRRRDFDRLRAALTRMS